MTFPLRTTVPGLRRVVLALLIATAWPAAAAERRVALVMGIWQYDASGLANLPGIEDDVKRFAERIKQLGFEVEISTNPTMGDAKAAIDQFGERLKQPDTVGLFYFSGHGSEHGGQNYLIPRKANLKTAGDLPQEAVAAQRVLQRMEESGAAVNLMFLDCCRNPINKKSADGSFAGMKASGVFIGFATASEKEANASSDGSLYTNALLKYMGEPSLSINDMHTKVTAEVQRITAELGDKQTPFLYSGLNNVFFMVPDGAKPPPPLPVQPVQPVVPVQPNPVEPELKPPVPAVSRWLFADSSERLLTSEELAGLGSNDLWRARNEIYARNGYIFASERGQALARHLGPEYQGTISDQYALSAVFNEYEIANVELIKRLEGGGSGGAPAPPPRAASPWLIPDSSSRRLTRAELSGLNAQQLWRARNEIYARHGYIFSKEAGRALARSLGPHYSPRSANADAIEGSFNAVESANVDLIKSME